MSGGPYKFQAEMYLRTGRNQMKLCNTCGNEISDMQSICPYCHSKQRTTKPKLEKIVTLNLEKGMPLAHEALNKLDAEIGKYSSLGVKIIKVIHGWGSSGTGGKIRELVIKRLRTKKQNGTIKHFYNCEISSKNTDEFQILLSLCPELSEHFKKDRKNKGVSYIIL